MTVEKGHTVHVNSATLIMGVTGSGKSALLGTLGEYVWETYKKILLLYSSDGGGFPAKVQALMQKGIIRVFRMRTRDLADGSLSFETCHRAAQGWWPAKINPSTGEVLPGEKMIPPITEKYDMSCPNGHLVKSVPFQSLLTATMCPQCKVLTDRTNMQVVKTAHRTKGFEEVGAVAYDGISSMLSWMMSDMSQRSGRLELKGEEGAIGGKVISGDMKFGGSSRSHYGFAQGHAENLVLNSLGIPFLVVPPTFTALTLETDDEGDLRIRGPKLAGKAKTDEAPQWFGNCLEAMVVKNPKDERIYRLCLSEFVDDQGVRHLVKTRADAGSLPAYLEDPALVAGHERETAFTNFNLGVFYTMLDAGLKQSLAEIDQQYPDAPGLPDGIVEVGEGTAEVVAVPQPSATPRPAPTAPAVRGAGQLAGKASTVPAGAQTQQAKLPAPTPAPPKAPPQRPPVPAPRPATVASPPAQPPKVQTTPAAPATPTGVPTTPPVVTQAPTGSPARQAWAAPAAPRPPAPAPRVGGRK